MKTIFDDLTREEVIKRINTLNENSTAAWGKMNVFQMLKHCTMWEEMIAGHKQYKRSLLGRLFGKIALKEIIKDEKPMKRNAPTVPGFKVTENGDVSSEKVKLMSLIRNNKNFSNPDFEHPFFGKMTKDQVGRLAYKHLDHHLRQFNS